MDTILISVVIPAYNIEEYIAGCLDSLLNQTHKNLEIIVVDDGSTDQTGVIIDRYAVVDSRVCPIHRKNGGVSKARLAGIRKASGAYIGFVDGDDIIEEDMYDRLLNNAIEYNADISHCGFQIVVNEGERIHYFYNTGEIIQQDNQTGIKDLIEGKFVEPSLCNKLFRRELLQQLLQSESMNWSLRINEDVLMNYYLFKEAKASIYEDFCPYHYLARSSSASRSDFKAYKVLEPVEVWKEILNDTAMELKDITWRRYLIACSVAYATLSDHKEYKEESEKLKAELKTNRDKWQFLTRNERIKARLMLISSGFYRTLYGVYEKTLQKKIYE